MTDFQGINSNGQLQQQLTVAVRQKNTSSSISEPPANGRSSIEKSGNTLPLSVSNTGRFEQESALQVQETVAKLSDFVQTIQRDLSFSIDETTGHTIITVRDSKTDEVIRQIPSETLVKLAQKLKELQDALGSPDSSKGNLLEIRV